MNKSLAIVILCILLAGVALNQQIVPDPLRGFGYKGGGGTVNQTIRSVLIGLDSGGTVISGTAQNCTYVPFTGTMTSLLFWSEDGTGQPQSGSGTFDILFDTTAQWTSATAPSTIRTGGSAPTYSSQTYKSVDISSNWNTTIAAGMYCLNMSSVTTTSRGKVALVITAN